METNHQVMMTKVPMTKINYTQLVSNTLEKSSCAGIKRRTVVGILPITKIKCIHSDNGMFTAKVFQANVPRSINLIVFQSKCS